MIMALVVRMNLELVQMDVKTTSFHGELEEVTFMDQPEGFVSKSYERKVYWLKRSIYGLKQSSRQWCLWFHQAMLQFGFPIVEDDHCIYLRRSNEKFLIVTLYVDDILMASNDLKMIATTKGWRHRTSIWRTWVIRVTCTELRSIWINLRGFLVSHKWHTLRTS